ncbi:right-handed parallel beta-helix repeat-containing protein [Methylobacterium currus]|uniref:Right-handed parallel beta-helix repeat-containing protein n=1 Tax=Methylobacterium currus TaxID=2051553 RepID=A0A2R4WQJ2_9HYPH|nr:right-handed parallel beta-helix repeat-containing protein [Methylobacterium currus]AWB23802.1 right-handed parallel beta-helix repeat-containing protein [Methylobacterium currus]
MTQIVYVDPSAVENGDGSLQSPLNTWLGMIFVPGNIYLQKSGTRFDANIMVTGQGTADAPITIGSYGAGSSPEAKGFWFDGASYTTLSGFKVDHNTQWASVAIARGSHHITISGNDISDSISGVAIAEDAGSDNMVIGNNIYDNNYFGITLENLSGSQLIQDNNVQGNGCDGIHLECNNAIVHHSLVQNNGKLIPGSSGIHTLTHSADSVGNNNIISHNAVLDTSDSGSGDGNGIQLDEWTHDNLVVGNLIAGNDGVGVSLYGAQNSQVLHNLISKNQTGTFAQHGIHAEVAVSSNASQAYLASGNLVAGNLIDPRTVLDWPIYTDNGYSNDENGKNATFLSNAVGPMAVQDFFEWNG